MHAARRTLISPLSRLLLAAMVILSACSYYSFTGATIPAHLRTVAVPLAEDLSASPISGMDQQLTDLLVNRFVRQTRLQLAPSEGNADAVLTARIERYQNQPTAVGGGDRAARNRVTITVAIRYLDRTRDEDMLQRTFNAFAEYDPIAEGVDGERRAAADALRSIADDAFTAATSNW
jgi:outer membrane lipopolysaccharide assembly protein LptE/RlpB